LAEREGTLLRRAAKHAFIALVASLPATQVGACFDTRLIPHEPTHAGGAFSAGAAGEGFELAGEGGASHAVAGAAGEAGAAGGNLPVGGSPGGSAGAGGGGPVRVTWLTLEGSEAPGVAPTNAALGINGHFYAYADDCAELEWDETSRCASGKLCDALGGQNWGVAVGFDFNSTGADGDPPSTKLTWDPRESGTLGVAFEIGGGAAPGLQLWVLNMDPVWAGQCSAMTCEIAGPPDGRRLLPRVGELLFDSMQKDDWGGGGIPYEFDPAAVHALQFKLPAIEVGAATFDFCIETLGVIR
jgi:hypothetical protein